MEESKKQTLSQSEQLKVQTEVSYAYKHFDSAPNHVQNQWLTLQRYNHIEYLTKGLEHLGPGFCCLDANRPWLCYWILHSIALLGESVDCDLEDNAIDFLSRCQDPDGGYGGGPGQLPHLATTYAAVNSLITLGGDKALSSINRHKLHNFLLRMKVSSGGFRMHDAGEIDVRACYTAISVASILNILDEELTENVGNYILSCQTYEGGIAGEPGTEAHVSCCNRYTFCGLATMILINEVDRLDLLSLIDWMAFRQGVESGFQGRTNKLVDGCYSFWQGGAMALLQRLSSRIDAQMRSSFIGEGEQTTGRTKASVKFESGGGSASAGSPAQGNLSDAGLSFLNRSAEADPFFDTIGLQRYLLLCSQDPHGGFKDKPGKHRDYYHTCYCLSGLSVCQHSWSKTAKSQPLPPAISGPYTNLLEPIQPLFNIVIDKYRQANDFFSVSY
ncbi:protein farnesyltransferase subunit beta-like isoform X1 [Papaver somniferum]|uniref:protein farnesyltransferase subunit beta-like isoform X1 n=1 Tax=Papaver somniferum TaxID=3469 RepID=UPI000E6F8BBA|nr:protein farnesyltransferase subunit beta-like isoform X1 [Papaver somniferum]